MRNGDLGIEAVFGVTDGGGNKAFGNGNPLQCTNITCNGNGLQCTNITCLGSFEAAARPSKP